MSETETLKATPKRWLHYRGLTSLVVTLSFLTMACSGVVLYFAPRGRDATWSGWTSLGLWREQWVAMHIAVATLLVLFGFVHLCFNWHPLWNYVYCRLRGRITLWKELLLACVLVAGLSVAAIKGLTPALQVVQGSDQMKDHWARTLPRAPFPHAELLTLEDMQRRTGISADILAQALRKSGYRVEGTSDSLLHIAEISGTTPAALFDVLRKEFPELGDLAPGRRGPGRGRMQL